MTMDQDYPQQFKKGQKVKVSDEYTGNVVEVEKQDGDIVTVWEYKMIGTSKVFSLKDYPADKLRPVTTGT